MNKLAVWTGTIYGLVMIVAMIKSGFSLIPVLLFLICLFTISYGLYPEIKEKLLNKKDSEEIKR